jgi:hypothetical protein
MIGFASRTDRFRDGSSATDLSTPGVQNSQIWTVFGMPALGYMTAPNTSSRIGSSERFSVVGIHEVVLW